MNNHKLASKVTGRQKEVIIEELSNYQDASTGDGKRMATQKETIKEIIGRSPDSSDTWIMRMYFEIKKKVSEDLSEQQIIVKSVMQNQFNKRKANFQANSNK